MPSTPKSIVRRLSGESEERRKLLRKLGSNTVIRVDQAILCCEAHENRIYSAVGSAVSQLASRISEVPRGGALGFNPALATTLLGRGLTVLTADQIAAAGAAGYAVGLKAGAAAAAGSLASQILGPGVVVLATYSMLRPIIDAIATQETLGLVVTTVGQMAAAQAEARQKKRGSGPCAECMMQRALGQSKRRQRQKVKILRRV